MEEVIFYDESLTFYKGGTMAYRLAISETQPTPIVRDFDTFVRYVADHDVRLTKVNEFISGRDLYRLNRNMTYSSPDTTPRSPQPFYPLLHLFYHLGLAGRLLVKASKKRGTFLKPTERVGLYLGLRPAEKYFFLLETLWVDVDWDRLTGFGHPQYSANEAMEYLGGRAPCRELEPGQLDIFIGWNDMLLYFSFFGFWDLVLDEEKTKRLDKRGFVVKSLVPTEFGVTVAGVLARTRDIFRWNLPLRREIFGEWKVKPGSPLPRGTVKFLREALGIKIPDYRVRKGESFFEPFVPLLPEGELTRTLPREEVKFIDGTYVFKVSLAGNIWRRIELSAGHTLLDLHRAIQDAYSFDDDHLYSFFMDGRPWSHDRFTSPEDDEGPHVDEVKIGELGLWPGQSFLYLFDYGDEWHFKVELEDIRTGEPKPSRPRIVESKGKAPEQYPPYDEW